MFQFPFADVLDLGQYCAEQQVDHPYFTVQGKRLVGAGSDPLGGHEHFQHRHIGRQGCIFGQADEGIEKRRKSRLKSLRDDDPPHGLGKGHPHTVAGFQLSLGNGKDRRPEGF